jgi:hypothetical protein
MDLLQPVLTAKEIGFEAHLPPHDRHGFGRAQKWAGDEIEICPAGQQVSQSTAVAGGLSTPFVIQRCIGLPLVAADGVPVRFPVPHEVQRYPIF